MTRTLANPMDLPYRFQDLSVGPFFRAVMREGADPSVVEYSGRYYLFMSMSAGFWHSRDLVDWTFVATPALPNYDYAPDARVIDGYLVVCASRRRNPCSFFRTRDPLEGIWEEIPGTIPFWDPNLFQDDDGRLYLYQGCSSRKPIDGVELDPTTFLPKGRPVALISSQADRHGWERLGESWNPSTVKRNRLLNLLIGDGPYIEGSWMTKHDGRYYLQYSAPGTEMNTYSDGYYTSQSPLGPFEYSPHSPFSSKPGGFMTGAGHGSTFEDVYGNVWHVATMRISRNYRFERRIGLFPAGFDEDGVLFCNQEFADYPMVLPDGRADPWALSPQSMLLSYKTPTTASSSEAGHGPQLATDEDVQTWWVAGNRRSGSWIQTEVPEGSLVSAVQINLAEHAMRPPKPARRDTSITTLFRRRIDATDPPTEVLVAGSVDGVVWEALEDTRATPQSRSHIYVELDTPTAYRFIRVTGFEQPYGGVLAVSGIRVFGHGAGNAPAEAKAVAHRAGPLDARIEWEPVAGAQGYNIRYGLRADKLYSSWLLYDSTALDLGSLNAGHEYWVAVDSFNENGVTRGHPVRITRAVAAGTRSRAADV